LFDAFLHASLGGLVVDDLGVGDEFVDGCTPILLIL